MDPRLCHLALGSNVGDRTATIEAAITAITAIVGVDVTARSPIIETEAVTLPGSDPQRPYRNAAITIETTLEPRVLLERLQSIEQTLGRVRACGGSGEQSGRWAPRTIDIDILLDGDRIIDEPGLTVPHPRMHERRFVLEPLSAIAPGARHPALKKTARAMLESLGPPAGGAVIATQASALLVLLAGMFAAMFGAMAFVQPVMAQAPGAEPAAAVTSRDPNEVYRRLVETYRAGPIAERVTLIADSEFRRREQHAVVRLDAASGTVMLELGPLRAVVRDGELRVTHERRGDRYARFPAASRSIPALLADALPPLPMPDFALAFDDPANPVHLTPFPGDFVWTAALDSATEPQLVLLGQSRDAIVSYVIDTNTWRLIVGVITTPGSRLRIEMRYEAIDPGDPAQWRLDLRGRSPVPTLAQLQPGGADINPGAPAPPMVFFTIASEPWRLEIDHRGPIALLLFREASPAVLDARDALRQSAAALEHPIDIQPVLVTEKLVGIDLFERIGQTVHAWGSPVLWSVSPDATIDRFTDAPACIVLIDAERTVVGIVDIGAGESLEQETQRIDEALDAMNPE